MADVQIVLGPRTFNTGVAAPLVDGARWFMGIPDGLDTASMRGRDEEPTGEHGLEELEALHGARILRCQGIVRASSQAAAWAAYRELRSLSPLGRDIELVVHEPGGSKFLLVRQGAEPVIDRPRSNNVTYTLTLKALYPFLRAVDPIDVPIAAGDSETFDDDGSAAAEIEVTTTGAGTVVLSAGGLTLTCGSVPSGTVLTSGPGFTNDAASVVGPGGEDLFAAMVPGYEWPAVVPGSNTFANTGTAPVIVRRYPTYE